jgi:hypothetical protein
VADRSAPAETGESMIQRLGKRVAPFAVFIIFTAAIIAPKTVIWISHVNP